MRRAVACVLRMLGGDPAGVVAEPGETRPTKTLDLIRPALVVALTLSATLLGVHWSFWAGRAEAARARFLTEKDGVSPQATALLRKVETTYFKDARGLEPAAAAEQANAVIERLPRDEGYVVSVMDQLRRRYRELEAEWGSLREVPAIESALKVWVEMYTALNGIDRSSLGWCRVASLDVTQTKATLGVEIEDAAVIDRIVSALVGNEYLRRRSKDPKRPIARGTFTRNEATGRYTGTIGLEFGDS